MHPIILPKNQLHMNTHYNKSYYAATGHFAKAHAKYFSERQYNQSRFLFISWFVFLLSVLFFSMNAMAQNTQNLYNAKTENKTENKTIGLKDKIGMTQEKQSGNLFEYLSMGAAVNQTATTQPFILESLPVVFTTAEMLPVLAGGDEQWNKLLQAYQASVGDMKSAQNENQVIVSYLVDATGKMYDVQVLKAANKGLAEKAIALMKATGISKPAFAQGQVVAYRGQLVLSFVQ